MESGHNGGGLAGTLSNRPFIVGALFLGTYFVPFLVLVGVALAYYFRRQPEEEWETSHFTYLIRTFWIAILLPAALLLLIAALAFSLEQAGVKLANQDLGVVVAFALVIVAIPILILSGVRIILSLMNSVSHKPMPNPQSLLL